MDASSIEHSDSDSAESWTLLENSPDENDKLKFQEKNNPEITAADNTDRDDDTDGISIISDSDPESTTACELSYYKCLSREEERSTEKPASNCIPINTPHHNNDEDTRPIQGDDDFLGDNNGKVRTYVHKRNRRLSTVLNVIMLGSIITAAGIAIGHMWGANISKDECSLNTFSSTNKILSKLYKLQEENAYLRSKLKELTLLYNVQTQHRRTETEKPIHKQRRCKKVFEGPLTSKKVQQHTKCVDNISNIEKTTLASHMMPSENENIISSNMVKLDPKENAMDNKIYKKVENNEPFAEQPETNFSSILQVDQEEKILEDNNSEKQPESHTQSAIDQQDNNVEALYMTDLEHTEPMKLLHLNMAENANRKVNYKTEFSSEPILKNVHIPLVSEDHGDVVSINLDEGYFKKDDRYFERKMKGKKKHDHQKSYKKQKRKNKYKQWEMKGGYLKDYDTVSENSSYEKVNKKKTRQNSEQKDYKDQYTVINDNILSEDNNVENTEEKNFTKDSNEKVHKEKNPSWYEKRAMLRMEARKRLERELFGESSSGNAGWYFRRMQRREQCRAKRDNSTYRRFTKHNLNNFKTKH